MLIQNYLFFRKILDIERELEKMSTPINTAMQHIDKLKTDLQNDHITRQTKIWEFTIKPKQTSNIKSTENIKKEEPKANFKIGNNSLTEVDYGEPLSLDKPLHFILGDTNNLNEKENHSPNVKENIQKQNIVDSTENTNLISNDDSIKTDNSSKELSNEAKTNVNGQRKIVPDFQIGAPASVIISNNQTLRYE